MDAISFEDALLQQLKHVRDLRREATEASQTAVLELREETLVQLRRRMLNAAQEGLRQHMAEFQAAVPRPDRRPSRARVRQKAGKLLPPPDPMTTLWPPEAEVTQLSFDQAPMPAPSGHPETEEPDEVRFLRRLLRTPGVAQPHLAHAAFLLRLWEQLQAVRAPDAPASG